jgi:hypothetical protein
MSDHFYRSTLYPAQDRILQTIAGVNTPFYLTGGTALGRFILNHRFSDDLDFFVNALPDFNNHVDAILEAVRMQHPELTVSMRQDSFVRIFVRESGTEVKLEFVNDVRYRVDAADRSGMGFWIDNWRNILTNKITALPRVAAKDFADILFLAIQYPFNWAEMITHARSKDAWIDEIAISQMLFNFDVSSMQSVAFPEQFDFRQIGDHFFKTLARDALHGFDNSLVGARLA